MTSFVKIPSLAVILCSTLAGQTLINGDRTLQGKLNYGVAGGTANTITVDLAPALLAYQEGICVSFKARASNTGSVTIDVNSLGGKTIKKKGPAGLEILAAGDLVVDGLYTACYDGTDMQLAAAPGSATGGASTGCISLPAANCSMGIATSGWQLDAAYPPNAACVTGTNTAYGVLSFAENTAGQTNAMTTKLGLRGTISSIDLSGAWRTAATSGDVVWQFQTACAADGETGDPGWNTVQTVFETAKGTALQWNDFSLTGLTLTGCATGETLFLKVLRDAAHPSDSLAATAELISLTLTINR